jgi:DNA-binding FadR family transcriptional regulator
VMRQHQAVFDAIEQRRPSAASGAMATLILQAAERVQIKHAGSSLASIQIHAFSESD